MRNVTIHQTALSDQAGILSLLDFGAADSGLNTIAGKARGGDSATLLTPTTTEVEAITFDSALPNVRPAFVKIDAESAEPAILRGMERMLALSRPVLLMEVGDYGIGESSTSGTMAWLGDRGYRPFEWDGADLIRHSPRADYPPGDMFYVHAEHPMVLA
jgi:FkbM family methyltransferase